MQRPSLFPSDDQLPTWLHTLLLVLIVSPFALYFFWYGFGALVSGHLEPVEIEFNTYAVGPKALDGTGARRGGLSLLALGGVYLAIAARFSRFAEESRAAKIAPWALFALYLLLSHWAQVAPGH